MIIIKIEPNDNGSHANQTCSMDFPAPDGWAIVPEDMLPLENFPFGEVTAEVIDGVSTVTSWTPLPMPEPEPDLVPEPTQLDRVEAQATYTALMTDTLLEV